MLPMLHRTKNYLPVCIIHSYISANRPHMSCLSSSYMKSFYLKFAEWSPYYTYRQNRDLTQFTESCIQEVPARISAAASTISTKIFVVFLNLARRIKGQDLDRCLSHPFRFIIH
jgi:hypothetical protein